MGQSIGLLDISVLQELRQFEGDSGGTLLDDLLKLYLETAPKSFQKIKEAVAAGNGALLESEAHSLKSSSGNLGARELQSLCQTFENYGAQKDLAKASAQLPQFEAEMEAVLASMRALQK